MVKLSRRRRRRWCGTDIYHLRTACEVVRFSPFQEEEEDDDEEEEEEAVGSERLPPETGV